MKRVVFGLCLSLIAVSAFAYRPNNCVRSTGGGVIGCGVHCQYLGPSGSACRSGSVYGREGYCWTVEYSVDPEHPEGTYQSCHDGAWDPCCEAPEDN
ncbi:MAG: hypothetical protein JOZ54_01005 [Acidobacteria bacterium]|nr:hypothetical protein [Acidobacteriota bacterium]